MQAPSPEHGSHGNEKQYHSCPTADLPPRSPRSAWQCNGVKSTQPPLSLSHSCSTVSARETQEAGGAFVAVAAFVVAAAAALSCPVPHAHAPAAHMHTVESGSSLAKTSLPP